MTVTAAAAAVMVPLTSSVPALTVTGPVKESLPVRVAVPLPDLTNEPPVPLTLLETVAVPAPPTVKVPAFRLTGLFVVRVIAPAVVLLTVPPAMVNAPVPRADALLTLSVPALRVTPPAKALAPLSVSVPGPAWVSPEIAPDRLHLSRLGYERLAPKLGELIDNLLAGR